MFNRRVYPLDPRELDQEQLAVVFAMTSRRPEPFDQIAERVSAERATDFHERWVLGYGHASVAEHAVLHLAVENISRLACDTLEDNRLASYTEKSSRYQLLDKGAYHIPRELEARPTLRKAYIKTCDALFDAYYELLEGVTRHLATIVPKREGERESAYALRLRRVATDNCRFLLPSATLTNVGVTLNARSLEHAITKLLSSNLEEERSLGEELKHEGRKITPTLIKYANENPYLIETQNAGVKLTTGQHPLASDKTSKARLVHYDPMAERKVASAFLYRFSSASYATIWERMQTIPREELDQVLEEAFRKLGDFDAPVRETEVAEYTLEFVLDYGAYRELKRHRMQTYISQPLTTAHGAVIPELIHEAGLETSFQKAIDLANKTYSQIADSNPRVAEYLVTHAHRRRVLVKLNLRECYHLFKLRTGPQAHFTLRDVMEDALQQCQEKHPALFRHLPRRLP